MSNLCRSPSPTLLALQSLLASSHQPRPRGHGQKKSYNYSVGIFSEAVTITNMGKGKFIFLAGVAQRTRTAAREDPPRRRFRGAVRLRLRQDQAYRSS